jgi:hypothetical protein
MTQAIERIGAGEGNRTLVISLEGCCSTIELHPQVPETLADFANFVLLPSRQDSDRTYLLPLNRRDLLQQASSGCKRRQ